MTRAEQRRAARAARRADRQNRQEGRQASRASRQQNRQGFLTNIVGDGGLGSLAEKVFAGPDQGADPALLATKEDETTAKDNTLLYVALGLGAYMLINKK